MTKEEMRKLPEDELKRIALLKQKNGCASSEARKAQAILWEKVDRFPCARTTHCDMDGRSFMADGNQPD